MVLSGVAANQISLQAAQGSTSWHLAYLKTLTPLPSFRGSCSGDSTVSALALTTASSWDSLSSLGFCFKVGFPGVAFPGALPGDFLSLLLSSPYPRDFKASLRDRNRFPQGDR